MKELSLFEQFLYEAPGDDPSPDSAPDTTPAEDTGGAPPDMPDEAPAEDDSPPDMGDDFGGDDMNDAPPEMGGEDDGGFEDDMGFGDDTDSNESQEDNNENNLELDEKISSILNMNLYQRYLTLLNTIGSQLTMIKNNSDILFTLSKDSLSIVEKLKKLDENIRLYLKNSFLHENYSKNLLFFNKCLNLLKLLNDIFDKDIRKGIKGTE